MTRREFFAAVTGAVAGLAAFRRARPPIALNIGRVRRMVVNPYIADPDTWWIRDGILMVPPQTKLEAELVVNSEKGRARPR